MADVKLRKLDGKEVLAVSMAVRNTGDGLSDAMLIDPVELHHDDEVCIVIKGRVIDVQSPKIKDTKGVTRKHIIQAYEGMIIDPDLVEPQLAEQRERVRVKHEEDAGLDPMFNGDSPSVPTGPNSRAAAEAKAAAEA